MYEVRFYKGDYGARQLAANADGCVAYVEHHFNATAGGGGNYACVVVGSNASNTSKNWARWYARAVADSFGIQLGGDQGVLVGGFNGRGDGNVKFTKMPAILVEPLFASNPDHAAWIRSEAGQDRLAQILVDSIRRCFPDGGRLAFSIGHKYKTTNPNDRGAAVHGGGTEADYAEIVLGKAAALLAVADRPVAARAFAVMVGNREVWRYDADPDAVVRWDEVRGILFIDEPGTLAPQMPAAPARRVGARRRNAVAVTDETRGVTRKPATRTKARRAAAKAGAATKAR
jgi:hypothetical protein